LHFTGGKIHEKALVRKEPVRLTYRDGEVMVTPEEKDIFFISLEKATEACREAVKTDERIVAFKAKFLVPLMTGARSTRTASRRATCPCLRVDSTRFS